MPPTTLSIAFLTAGVPETVSVTASPPFTNTPNKIDSRSTFIFISATESPGSPKIVATSSSAVTAIPIEPEIVPFGVTFFVTVTGAVATFPAAVKALESLPLFSSTPAFTKLAKIGDFFPSSINFSAFRAAEIPPNPPTPSWTISDSIAISSVLASTLGTNSCSPSTPNNSGVERIPRKVSAVVFFTNSPIGVVVGGGTSRLVPSGSVITFPIPGRSTTLEPCSDSYRLSFSARICSNSSCLACLSRAVSPPSICVNSPVPPGPMP